MTNGPYTKGDFTFWLVAVTKLNGLQHIHRRCVLKMKHKDEDVSTSTCTLSNLPSDGVMNISLLSWHVNMEENKNTKQCYKIELECLSAIRKLYIGHRLTTSGDSFYMKLKLSVRESALSFANLFGLSKFDERGCVVILDGPENW